MTKSERGRLRRINTTGNVDSGGNSIFDTTQHFVTNRQGSVVAVLDEASAVSESDQSLGGKPGFPIAYVHYDTYHVDPMNAKHRSENCTCIALFDTRECFGTKEFYRFAMEFFRMANAIPDLASIGEDGDSQPVAFRIAAESSTTADFDRLRQLSMFSTLANYQQLSFGWWVTTAWARVPHPTAVFCADSKQIGGGKFSAFLLSLVCASSPRYGFVYDMPFGDGPDLFAYGMAVPRGFGAAEMARTDGIGAWMRERAGENRHLVGLHRDVFSMNILSQAHMNRRVSGSTFTEWVSASTHRGQLSQVSSDNWLWRVAIKDRAQVRTEFDKQGLLVAPGSAPESNWTAANGAHMRL